MRKTVIKTSDRVILMNLLIDREFVDQIARQGEIKERSHWHEALIAKFSAREIEKYLRKFSWPVYAFLLKF